MSFRPARNAKPAAKFQAFRHGKDIKSQPEILELKEELPQPLECEQVDEEETVSQDTSCEDSADDEAAFREHCKDMFEKHDVPTVSLWLDLEKKKFLKKQPPQKKQKK